MHKAFLVVLCFIVFTGCMGGESSQNPEENNTQAEPAETQDMTSPGHSIKVTAFRYGTSQFGSQFIFHNDPYERPLDFGWMFFLIEYDDHKVLIDTGYNDQEMSELFGVTWEDPIELLEMYGLAPNEITHIIITHAHFDHIGTVDLFPQAYVYIHQNALNSLTQDVAGMEVVQRFGDDSTYTAFADETRILDIFRLVPVQGHAAGSTAVYIELPEATLLFPSDEVILYENLENREPIGYAYSLEANRQFIQSITDEVVFPFHDPSVVSQGNPFQTVYEAEF
ncbi:MAG: N-acyl homoserine lactonase family protein [Spirochaetia bacterium]